MLQADPTIPSWSFPGSAKTGPNQDQTLAKFLAIFVMVCHRSNMAMQCKILTFQMLLFKAFTCQMFPHKCHHPKYCYAYFAMELLLFKFCLANVVMQMLHWKWHYTNLARKIPTKNIYSDGMVGVQTIHNGMQTTQPRYFPFQRL